ncbi:outer membrane beta-barrel protein [Crocinitomix catalasitica]|uniref:outer membrane beta-barrel protein n=1 Tax=Crocinitomix catalasitica TaxID=184607 RepID=UPI0004828EF0|nr:outer membrane beta-barrel protein [Crocinitomix catalasitica]
MKTILNLTLFAMLTCIASISNAQETEAEENNIFIEYIMGPYLFIDHIPYDAVFMNGCRLGYEFHPRFNTSLEYVVGQQQDDKNTLGMTHNVNAQLAFYPNANPKKFNPYLFIGGGFFEFKAFSNDVYGISYHAGAGTTLKITERLASVIEARYLNLGLMNLGGEHEIAVFWGVRFNF